MLICGLMLLTAIATPVNDGAMGLHVDSQGILMKDGEPFHGIGVNYFDLFYRCLKDPEDVSYKQGLSILSEQGIPFARFMCGGFWPTENALYFEDRDRYFSLMDDVVKEAENTGIGLIPSLFWHTSTVPDLVKEPVNQWGNPDSKTHSFMKQYVSEIVARYKDSPAILAWEFGNEYNLGADLPNASSHRPPIVPHLGTPDTRSEEDELSRKDIRIAFQGFARVVRELDKHRLITTGNSLPRASAWHQGAEGTWEQDSAAQLAEVLMQDHPDPIQGISIHAYTQEKRFGEVIPDDVLLSMVMGIVATEKKILFVGEFGASEKDDSDKEKERFTTLLAAIEKARIPIAALWVYDFSGQDETWNVTEDNSRSYQLNAIAEANARMKE